MYFCFTYTLALSKTFEKIIYAKIKKFYKHF